MEVKCVMSTLVTLDLCQSTLMEQQEKEKFMFEKWTENCHVE